MKADVSLERRVYNAIALLVHFVVLGGCSKKGSNDRRDARRSSDQTILAYDLPSPPSSSSI